MTTKAFLSKPLLGYKIISNQPAIRLQEWLRRIHARYKQAPAINKYASLDSVTSLMPGMPVSMIILQADGSIYAANAHLCRQLQIDEQQLTRTNLADHLQSSFRQLFKDWLTDPAVALTGEVDFLQKQHASITIAATPYRYKKQLYYLATIEHAHKAKEDSIRYKEFADRFQTILESEANVVWDYDFETGESFYNYSMFRLLGYQPEEVRDNPTWWSGNIHPFHRERVLENLYQCLAEKERVWEDEYPFRCANGEYKMIKDRGLIKRDSKGKPYRLLGFMHDVTQQLQLQQQLKAKDRQHEIELAKAMSNAQEAERKNISEELHDNVCQVLGGVKLFIEHCMVGETKNNTLLKQSAAHLNDVIDELRKMAHVLSPNFVEQFGLLSAITEIVYFTTNFRNLKVNLDISEFDESIIVGNRKLLLYRIIQEHMNNIIKHAQATVVNVELQNAGPDCLLMISDNGVGVNLNERKEGLGLMNIRNRVQLMKGGVQFISSEGKGFCMKLWFTADKSQKAD